MFRKLVGSKSGPAPEARDVVDRVQTQVRGNDGVLLYAIGDVHGRADLLAQLLRKIEADFVGAALPTRPVVLFMGDYVDRGPESRGVIEQIVALTADPRVNVHALRGNHDQFLLDFLESPEIGMTWLDYGGAATLMSYGVMPPLIRTEAASWKPVAEALNAAMPRAHLDFLQNTSLSATFGGYVFAHAGVRPDVDLEDQEASDLLSIRKPFLKSRDPLPGRVVVYGHTPHDRPAVRDGKMGIDTGAYATGVLTAARIFEDQVTFIHT